MKGGIMMRLGSKPRIGVLLVILVLLTSCSSRYWVRPVETDLRIGETVYRLKTLEGDTVSYVALAFTGTGYSSLRDEEYLMPYGKGGEYDGAFVHGVLHDGTERYVSIERISMIEVERFNTMKTVLYVGGGIVIAGLILVTTLYLSGYGVGGGF